MSICLRLTRCVVRHVCYELWRLTPIFEKKKPPPRPEEKAYVEARLRPLCVRGVARKVAAAVASGMTPPTTPRVQNFNNYQSTWRNHKDGLKEAFKHLMPAAPAIPCPPA